MSSCVLCGVDIVKNTDKNLVDGRRGNSFKVREELLSLECKVEINSTYICRNCLCALKKRRALLNNLHEVNSSIQKIPIRNKNSRKGNQRLNKINKVKKTFCLLLHNTNHQCQTSNKL